MSDQIKQIAERLQGLRDVLELTPDEVAKSCQLSVEEYLGVTFLASKKVIIHASTSNILCRKNEFGKVDNKAVLASSDHFFYVGVYVTLGKKAAYDVSNF